MLPSNPRAGLPSNPRFRVAGPSFSFSDDETRGRRNETPRRDYRIESSQSTQRDTPVRDGSRTRNGTSRGPGLPDRAPSRPRTSSLAQNSARARSHSRPPATSRYQDVPAEADVPLPAPSRILSTFSRRSDDSSSSLSSSGSSMFDRRSEGGGYTSSRTSFEDDEERRTAKPISSFRNRTAPNVDYGSRSRSPDDGGHLNHSSAAYQGHGYDIWSRVTNVATALTVNVSKAWAVNIVTFAGEETPPGSESRLTRAMKAYHASKAQSSSDLPDWLFTERERRVRVSPLTSRMTERHDDHAKAGISVGEPAKRRDLHESSAPSSFAPSIQRTVRPVDRNDHGASVQPKIARGADRLKAMRDARRNATNTGSSQHITTEVDMNVRHRDKTMPASDAPRARSAGGGLPSGPRRG